MCTAQRVRRSNAFLPALALSAWRGWSRHPWLRRYCPPCELGVGCDEDNDSCGQPAWCTEGRDGCLAPGDCDGDGSRHQLECGGDDCDDTDGDRKPGNPERCDAEGHDEDCNPETVAGEHDGDLDGDGFVSNLCCNGSACGSDCDDTRRDVHPGATELCNAIDDDCDGVVDNAGAFCPIGSCIEQRCRATSWLRAFGSTVYDEPKHVITSRTGKIFALVSAGGPMTVGRDDLAAGRHVLAHSVDGRYEWSFHGDAEVIILNNETGVLAIMGSEEVLLVDADDARDRGSWLLTYPTSYSGDGLFRNLFAQVEGDGILLAATLTSARDESAGIVQRINWNGSVLSERLFDGPGENPIMGFGVDPAGGAVVVVRADAPIDLGLGGSVGPGNIVVRLTHDLVPTWAVTLPRPPLPDTMTVDDLAVSADGVMLVGSYTREATLPWGESWSHSGGQDGFAVMLERADGAHRWTKLHNTIGRDTFELVHFDNRGGVVVGGRFGGVVDAGIGPWTVDGPQDGFLLTMDVEDGVVLDGKRFTGPGMEAVQALAVDPFGALVVGGTFTDTASLNNFPTTSRGGYDIFLTRISD